MCSFLLTISIEKISRSQLSIANNYLKSRGPSHTNLINFTKYNLNYGAVHNLLDISNSFINQPIFEDLENMLLFNGEIYEPNNGIPDSLNLYQKLKKNQLENYLKAANGEFAICALNLSQKKLNLYTDLIGTKPIYYGCNDRTICVASYAKPINILGIENVQEIKPNTKVTIDYSDWNKIEFIENSIYELNIDQNNNNFNIWVNSFIKSIKFKASHFNSKICIPLSSGYDSGAICCALNILNIPYETIHVGDAENKKILNERIKINKKYSCRRHHSIPPLSKSESKSISEFIYKKLGDIKYDHIDLPGGDPISLHEDSGAIGLAVLCKEISKKGFNVIITGSGADEIISDYGFNGKKIYSHSEFGGLFPDNLQGFFPWRKFYGDTQRSYLKKDEMISGLFGIEGRYPFLDREVIQSFLNLSHKLKNSNYKSCIAYFLDQNSYPYNNGVKDGFYPEKSDFNFLEKVSRKFNTLLKNHKIIK